MNFIETSVLIPSFNCAWNLLECIGSILRQDYKNYEIIIIDDYSTDNTSQIVKGLRNITNTLKYYKNPREKGLVNALNFGISKCNGKYIARMDADDLMMGNRLLEQISFLERNPEYVAVCSSMQLVDKNGLFLSNKILSEDDRFNNFMLLFCNVFVHGSMTFKKEILDNNPYDYEFAYCEDYELWTRIAQFGKIKCLKSIHHIYRIYESTSKNTESIRIQRANMLKLYATILDGYEIEFDKDELLLHFTLFNMYPNVVPKIKIKLWLDKVLTSPKLLDAFGIDFIRSQKHYLQQNLSLVYV